jgi:hypothetical protein
MRRALGAAAFFAAVAAVLLLPLIPRFGSAFPHDAGDPVLNAWILWHESRHLPLTAAWWNAPMFFPSANVLALSEVLLSLVPLSWMVQTLTGNPVLAYNVVFAVTFPLSGLAAYALARDLTGRTDAAIVAGLAFMLAPYRAAQLAHVQVLAYFWTPLVLLGLHRYLRDPRRRWLVLFGGAWLAQALANGYAMFHVSILVALWILWFARSARTALPILGAWALAALPLAPILLKYLEVHSALHLTRDINEVRRFGVDLADFLTAPPDLLVWGGRLGRARPETAVFPGITVLVLAVAALASARLRASPGRTISGPATAARRDGYPAAPGAGADAARRALVLISALAALVAFSVFIVGPWAIGPLSVRDFHKPFSIAVAARVAAFLAGPWVQGQWRTRSIAGFYLLMVAAMYVLALGPEPRLLGRPMLYEPPYAWLMRLPGFETLRVPARFAMIAVFCQSVLVALALARWARGRYARAIVAAAAIGICADGWFYLPVAEAPKPPPPRRSEVAAVVELPLGVADVDFGAMFRSMIHEQPIVNGFSGYLPPQYLPLERSLRDGAYDALYAISPSAPIAIALDRVRAGAPAIEADLRATGFRPLGSEGEWALFEVPPRPPAMEPRGSPLAIASVHASRHPEDVARMLDRDVTTAWGTELPQVGGEEVAIELGAPSDIASIVLEMGAFSFGYPSALEIAVSSDGAAWSTVWGGRPGPPAVRGAIQDPGAAPVAIAFPPAHGRFVRLRQTGAEPGIPWWIAELTVHAPLQLAPSSEQSPSRN